MSQIFLIENCIKNPRNIYILQKKKKKKTKSEKHKRNLATILFIPCRSILHGGFSCSRRRNNNVELVSDEAPAREFLARSAEHAPHVSPS